MAEQEIVKHTKEIYNTLSKPGGWKHKLVDILFEILIIVFAVSISIWLHNWSEERKDRREEKEFLTGLKSDLQDDITEMKGDTTAYHRLLHGMLYFSKVGAGMPLNKDSLNTYYWIFFATVHKQARTSRFEALKGSGKLDIIENKKLLQNIISLYQEIEPQIIQADLNFDDYMVNRVGAYFDAHAQMDTTYYITNWQQLLTAPQIRMALTRVNGVQDIISAYDAGLDKCNGILSEINEEMK